jgi:hypothetical protein
MAAERAQQVKALILLQAAEKEYEKKKQQSTREDSIKTHGDVRLDDLFSIER